MEDQHEASGATAQEPESEHRTRRSVLFAAVGAAGAFVAQAIGRPAPVAAADVVLGTTNNTTAQTTIRNTSATATAVALVGQTTYTGAAQQSRGVVGVSNGQGGVGVAGSAAVGANAQGVLGNAAQGTGVRAKGGHTGVLGTGTNYGAYGESASNYGVYGVGGYTGVFGSGPYGTYGTGSSAGAVGTSNAGYGLYGTGPVGAVGLATGDGYGVWGYGSDSGAYGVVGQGGYRGVYGSGGNAGVYGSSGYVGVWGVATTTSGLNYGVYSDTGSQTQGWAGVFNGRVYVGGFLQKVGGGFVIDHPMEPETKYLVHSFVESPEMLNVYSGIATLDAKGTAKVDLPRYFEVENRDHRYQLTAIGAAAPDLHVASGVKKNAFTIAGGAAGQQVSWQVTGVRQDAWAKANPLVVEPDKEDHAKGKFLQPKAHGKSAKDAIHNPKRPEAGPQERTVTTLKATPKVAAPPS